jgi:hypothetical protein
MPICPVCRSQNMETAKFCGNCGNPFPRTSETTSSLLKCEQGHIYSAIYQHCPYCPAQDVASGSNFETRIEEPVAFVEPPPLRPPSGGTSGGDFATRIEAPAFSSGDLATRIETPVPAEFLTNIEVPLAPTDELANPAAEKRGSTPAPAEPLPGTEILSDVSGAAPPPRFEATRFETRFEEPSPFSAPAVSTPMPPPPPPPQPAQPPLPPPQLATPPAPPSATSPVGGRHTSVMSVEDVKRATGSKGKLVGWLISYTRNPDGEDFRLRAGYNRLGANPACDIVIEDETVSGSHAILVFRDGRCLIKDDLSRNGTFVNGKEITEAHPLQNYDQIRVGNTILTYVAAQNG